MLHRAGCAPALLFLVVAAVTSAPFCVRRPGPAQWVKAGPGAYYAPTA
jgi:hypothetical protein